LTRVKRATARPDRGVAHEGPVWTPSPPAGTCSTSSPRRSAWASSRRRWRSWSGARKRRERRGGGSAPSAADPPRSRWWAGSSSSRTTAGSPLTSRWSSRPRPACGGSACGRCGA